MRTCLALFLLGAGAAAASASTTITGGNVIDQTWTVAGSPYIVEGDLTVPPGSTLTIEAGVTVEMPRGDMQASGLSTTQTEITVAGALDVKGTAAAPVTFAGDGANSWYGLVIAPTATSVHIDRAVIANPYIGISYGASGNVMTGSGIDIELPWNGGVTVTAGTPSFDGVIVHGISGTTTIGVESGSELGSLAMTNCEITDVYYGASVGGGTEAVAGLSLAGCTIDHVTIGVSISDYTKVHITDSIITNGAIGVDAAGTIGNDISVTYTDVWNHTAGDFQGVNQGIGCLSANPQYVSATDRHLQASSVAIDSGTSGPDHDLDGHPRPVDGNGIGGAQWDMGAYEYGSSAGGGGGSGDAGIPTTPPDGAVGAGDGGFGDQAGDAGRGGARASGGCCDAGGSGQGSILLALSLVAALARPRRSRARAS